MNAMFVRRGSPSQAVYRYTKEFTLETNLINVMFVTRGLPHQAIY
jgi:hypothetical protein